MKIFSLRTLLAGIGSAIILAVWGMVFWGWLYEVFGIFNKLPGDAEVVEMLIANGTETGTYFFPWPSTTTAFCKDTPFGHNIVIMSKGEE
jgi:hypothetical protein